MVAAGVGVAAGAVVVGKPVAARAEKGGPLAGEDPVTRPERSRH